MSNCHTCHWADRDPKSGEQVIHKEPDFLAPGIDPVTGNVPDIRIVKSCGKGAFYYKTYGARDHDCKKWEDGKQAAAVEAAVEAEKAKTWETPTSRPKLPKTENMLELIEVMAEKHSPAFDILFDVMGSHYEKLLKLIKDLDDMNIRGRQIVIAREAGTSTDQWLTMVSARAKQLVQYVNDNYDNVDKEEAVQRGASKYGHGPHKRRRAEPKPRVMKLEKFKKMRAKAKTAVKPNPHAGR
jgi:hypothetical protein